MTFKIDTGQRIEAPRAQFIEEGQAIRFVDYLKAERKARQVIENIEVCETVEMLERYMIEESVLIDAIFLFDNSLTEPIVAAYRDHKLILKGAIEAAERLAANAAEPKLAEPTNKLGIKF